MNFTLNVLVPFIPPLAFWNAGDLIPKGHGIELWKYVTHTQNIKYQFMLYRNLSFVDVLNLLQNTTKNDVVIMDTYINYERHKTLGFSLPYASTSAALMSHVSNNCLDSSATFLPSLSILAAFLMVVYFVIVAICLTSERCQTINKSSFKTTLLIEIGENMLEPCRILLRQAIPRVPRFLWIRIVVLSFILGMLFLMLTYQNEMKVNMALCAGTAPDTLDQLLQDFEFRRKQLYVPQLIQKRLKITAPLKKRIGSKSKTISLGESANLADLKMKLVDLGVVDFTYVNNIFRALNKLCVKDNEILSAEEHGFKFHVGRTKYFPQSICMATRLGLPKKLMEHINLRVLTYSETGLRQYMEKKRWFILNTCLGPHFYSGTVIDDFNSAELEGLPLSSVSRCFTWWIRGLTSAFLVLGVEVLFYKIAHLLKDVKRKG